MKEEFILKKKLVLRWLSVSKKVSLWFEFLCNDKTIFFFECNESINWAYKLAEMFILKF